MSISKRLRFEIFKIDNFSCRYCGRTPPSVILEIDHIIPVSKGGKDNKENLITACFDCNRGKTNILLMEKNKNSLEIIKEREAQIKAFNKLLMKQRQRFDNEADEINKIFSKFWNNEYSLSDKGLLSVKKFLKKLPFAIVLEAAEIATTKNLIIKNQEFQYFCGICHRKIREGENKLNDC